MCPCITDVVPCDLLCKEHTATFWFGQLVVNNQPRSHSYFVYDNTKNLNNNTFLCQKWKKFKLFCMFGGLTFQLTSLLASQTKFFTKQVLMLVRSNNSSITSKTWKHQASNYLLYIMLVIILYLTCKPVPTIKQQFFWNAMLRMLPTKYKFFTPEKVDLFKGYPEKKIRGSHTFFR